MAQLQYIGARYVPKFYENSLDHSSMDWESGVGYEPLTVVTYNSDTYTSKVPVPSTVGAPDANPSYWAKTADYNAALVALQNQVNSLDNDLDNLTTDFNTYKKGRYIFIGDSYNTGYPSYNTNWADIVATMLDISGDDYYNFCEDGSGIIQKGTSNRTYQEFFDDLKVNIVNPQTITHVIITLAYNDITAFLGGATDAQFVSAAQHLIDDIKSICPGAKIYVGIIGGSIYFESYVTLYNRIVDDLNKVMGFSWYDNCQYVFSDKSLLDGTYHPTSMGHSILAYAMYSCILSGTCNIGYYNKNSAVAPATGVTITGLQFETRVYNETTAVLCFKNANIAFATPVTINSTLGAGNKLGTLSGDVFKRFNPGPTGASVQLKFKTVGFIGGVLHPLEYSVLGDEVYITSDTELLNVSAIDTYGGSEQDISTLYT